MKTKMTDNQTASAQYDDNIDAIMELLDDIRATCDQIFHLLSTCPS